ncbi:MAG TPA: ceramidase domain-containing protein, partial [Hyphomicrobium sp.]|nr:ceramidase domain-containing protein [Hyphomicrobium sp.]
MAWTDKIFAYCERAGDPAFWAEPFNAISNVAFLIAALAGAVLLVRTPNARERRIEWGLVLLVTIIGIGSFLFHTYATRWASVADTAPIGIFMIGYLGFAMRRFLGASYVAVLVALGLFIA